MYIYKHGPVLINIESKIGFIGNIWAEELCHKVRSNKSAEESLTLVRDKREEVLGKY